MRAGLVTLAHGFLCTLTSMIMYYKDFRCNAGQTAKELNMLVHLLRTHTRKNGVRSAIARPHVLMQYGPAAVIGRHSDTVVRLDQRGGNGGLNHIGVSQVLDVRIAEPRVAGKKEYILNTIERRLLYGNTELLQPSQLILCKTDGLILRDAYDRTESLEVIYLVILVVVSPAEETAQEFKIFLHC